MIKVTVWNENLHEQRQEEVRQIYPHGIHGCIADFLEQDRNLLVRRFYLTATRVLPEGETPAKEAEQLDLFTDYVALEEKQAQEAAALEREKKLQKTMLDIKKRFGKNAILKGMNLEEGATARERNNTIGGHRSGEI